MLPWLPKVSCKKSCMPNAKLPGWARHASGGATCIQNNFGNPHQKLQACSPPVYPATTPFSCIPELIVVVHPASGQQGAFPWLSLQSGHGFPAKTEVAGFLQDLYKRQQWSVLWKKANQVDSNKNVCAPWICSAMVKAKPFNFLAACLSLKFQNFQSSSIGMCSLPSAWHSN